MIIVYLILGIVQGFTEPIPVSSSGHLIIFQELFKMDSLKDMNLEIFTNFGSFIAIIIIFRNDIVKLIKAFFMYIKLHSNKYKDDFDYCMLIIIGTIPAGVIGLLFNDVIEQYFSKAKYVGVALLVTALFLFMIRKMKGHKKDNQITYIDAIKIGLFQAVALIPGISRSGATLVGGMFSDLNRETAFKFSFMLYIPITIATMILGVKDVFDVGLDSSMIFNYVLAAVAACIVTFFSAKWFKGIMLKGKLMYFVYYCLIAGTLVIIFL